MTELSGLENKLDVLIRLTALAVAPDGQPLKDRALRLSSAGMTPKEIAHLCNTTPHTVSVVLSAERKNRKKKPK